MRNKLVHVDLPPSLLAIIAVTSFAGALFLFLTPGDYYHGVRKLPAQSRDYYHGVGDLPVQSRAVDAQTVTRILETLDVRDPAARAGYDRARFGPAWSDDTNVSGGHNGCDTRNDVLARDMILVLAPGGCRVQSGTLDDPYTGRVIRWRRGQDTSTAVQIDHVVSLSDAWSTGAQRMTPEQRQQLANDPDNLSAVDGPTNQAKSDHPADEWLPPNKTIHCWYVAQQIKIKSRYNLWVTTDEKSVMRSVLNHCPQKKTK
jgi:hypothetical protein